MYFHIGRHVIFLFKGWGAKDTKELAFYLVLIFALAIIYECLRGLQKFYVFRLRMPKRRLIRSQEEKDIVLRQRLRKHILSTLIYIVQISFGYALMLLVMTYNYIIFVVTIFGITLGYYLSEPLIGRGIENLYIARTERMLLEEHLKTSNGHREQLLERIVEETNVS